MLQGECSREKKELFNTYTITRTGLGHTNDGHFHFLTGFLKRILGDSMAYSDQELDFLVL
jgi:hypothetical protein